MLNKSDWITFIATGLPILCAAVLGIAIRTHPVEEQYWPSDQVEYLEEKSELWLAAVRKSPDLFIQQSFNRLAAAFFMYSPVALSEHNFPRILAMNRIWNAMPLVCILVALFWKNLVFSPKLTIAFWIWVLGLLPYVLISYYDRYSWPLLPMQVVIVSEVLSTIWFCTFGANRYAPPVNHEHSSSLHPLVPTHRSSN